MTQQKLKSIFLFSLILLFILILIQIKDFPGGMFFPGFYFGLIYVIGVLLTCLFISLILIQISKKISFQLCFTSLSSISFIIFLIYFYSPTLKIIVPNNYSGEIDLVLSNVDKNILIVDENGIGYINQYTFDKTYKRPKVFNQNGENLDSQLKGFNNLIFWSHTGDCCINEKYSIESLNFEILPKNQKKNEFKFRSLSQLVNQNKVKLINDEKILATEVMVEMDTIFKQTE